jgi:hypothetical protein
MLKPTLPAACLCVSILFAGSTSMRANDTTADNLKLTFDNKILPLIHDHCISCHDAETLEGNLDMTAFRRVEDIRGAHPTWELVLSRVVAGEMPPRDASTTMSAEERQKFTQWIRDFRNFEAQQNAGDPGIVLPHRLSNAEYDYSIRDLTGVDIRPTKTFPVDPANESGFDNTGESLTMSPALLKKYLEAARTVTDFLVFTPHGLRFAPHPVVTDTDRDKYCVKRIVEFYQRQPTRYADYFFAAWSFRNRESLGKADASLTDIAIEQSVSPKYLAAVWELLTAEAAEIGPLVKLQELWNSLPSGAPLNPASIAQAQTVCAEMQKYVVDVRKEFEPTFDNLNIREVHNGAQPFVLWKNKQYANHRRTADFTFLDPPPPQPEKNQRGNKNRERDEVDTQAAASPIVAAPAAEETAQFKAACNYFCSVFPDAFYISERGRDYLGTPKDQQEKGRLLSAGFHSMTGYFRDDKPLYELILDEQGQQELDELWQELDFFAAAPQRQYQGFLWFERTDSRFMRDAKFDFARPEDKSSLSESSIQKLGELYTAKAASNGGKEVPLQAIRDYFVEINQQIRWVEQARIEAEPKHLQALIEFAARAYRRPLTEDQEQDLRRFYHSLRESNELSHEEAIQDTLTSILMSPNFCYRLDLLSDSDQPRRLDDFELASRLSYFLWSSVPDAELLQLAAANELHQPEILLAQTKRMLTDDRIRGLVTEFGGNWLDFRRFEEHNSVDRQRFPTFDDELRSAMFEEPIRFILDVVRQDRSIREFISSDRTFVNAALAKHYGMTDLAIGDDQWVQVEDASRYDRGGLLTMAVFLTKNAPGLRTSPVKRGYWVVRRLLGERIPAPPPNVPELPNDESQLGELTLRETLAKHRDHSSCAGCHNRFDAIGLVFEGFGPVGERRDKDLGGRDVDNRATFPDASERQGVSDLRKYLEESREQEFLDNTCRKLLSYGLGRSLQISDEILVQKMRQNLESDEHRFSSMVKAIVTSPQFLNKRGRDLPKGQ